MKYSLAPVFKKYGIEIALDMQGATWLNSGLNRRKTLKNEIKLLERFERLGLTVQYITLQSVLSRPLLLNGKRVSYPLAKQQFR